VAAMSLNLGTSSGIVLYEVNAALSDFAKANEQA